MSIYANAALGKTGAPALYSEAWPLSLKLLSPDPFSAVGAKAHYKVIIVDKELIIDSTGEAVDIAILEDRKLVEQGMSDYVKGLVKEE